MRFVDSRCIHCGATLRVAQDAAYVCCHYCKAELQIVRDGPELTTRLLGEMNENLGQKLDVLVDALFDMMTREEWTLLVSSHEIEEVERLADFVVILDAGKVALCEEKDTLLGRGERAVEMTRAFGWLETQPARHTSCLCHFRGA